jgi:peptidoglycan/LPS O-acetylase OafA/YrhL
MKFTRIVATGPLTESLSRSKNNFDLLRLLLAFGVLFGHAITLAPHYYSDVRMDVFQKYTGYPIAAFSVKGFFLVSGILVTSSLLATGSVLNYIVFRFFRIFPALFGVVVFSAFVIGPYVTTLGIFEYFRTSGVYQYVLGQLTFRTWASTNQSFFQLPGVFGDNRYPNAVNASLWSLTPEVYAYILLAVLFVVFLRSRNAIAVIAGLVIIDSMAQTRLIFTSLPKGVLDFSDLPFFFAVGVLLALYQEKIHLNFSFLLSLGILALVLRNELIGTQIKLLFVLILLISVFIRKWPSIFVPKRDLSYGVFLYGFPISQLVTYKFPDLQDFTIYFAIVFAITMTLAYFSARWIEKPSISLGRAVAEKLNATSFGPLRSRSLNL